MEQTVRFKLHRHYFHSAEPIQILQIFVDANQEAFGASIYISNGPKVSLVATKTRVASSEKWTIILQSQNFKQNLA